MAKINKKQAVKRNVGLPSKEAIMTAPQNTDTLNATIQGIDGSEQGPAKLTEGEIVFSVPAIIAAGEGDYDRGAEFLMNLQEELRIKGEEMLAEMEGSRPTPKGLAAV